ncbi:MAG: methionyl-tRNA formyltransferase [Janthinobacterium lividum]
MKVVLIGQQAFGKAVLDAFLARGDTVAAVFCAPEKGRPDPLRLAGEAAGIPTHMFPKLGSPEALDALRAADADIGIMAYVTQFVSQEFCAVPTHGTIQFHPSLLPLHRGASAMSWSIILGRRETGFTIFRPSDGLDEGPVIFTRTVEITPTDTLVTVYFGKIFPQGVAGLLEAADLVLAGKGNATAQVEDTATYEGIIGDAESQIHWHQHVDQVFDLIRGCDPAPAAWTTYDGRRLDLFDAEKQPARTFAEVKGKKMGQLIAVSADGALIQAQGGAILAKRVRLDGGKKIAPTDADLTPGTILGR